ncbi:hypothetical protein IM817_24715 [Serratia marcescens]|jgi:hypothetical protein|uniref:Lipoprotein n=3 Tax=Serratia TaxID=613 RepID=A0AAX2Y8P8_9GAMM|nr:MULTISPECIES: hypothetical protein [Serratia]RNW04947.1 hypothetical protein CAG37_019710 [Serratia nematodiphila]AKL41799.1 hypothetical protein AB188_15090 [Serratia marcescens]APS32996.1 hypothetical protein RN42_03645 [Serratia marcescens]AUY12573.1 hypothetical protein C3F38_01090 [Serratia sp. SSNIH1]AVU37523.1 hypothetical protein AM681_24345 [Serratia marcescens]
MITMINACGGRRKVGLAIFLLSFMVLSGCADGSKTKLNSVKKLSQNNPNDKSDEQRIALCQQRVNSLKNINPQSYQKRIAYFNGLLSNASGYAGVRGNVDESTRKAIDALYQYKTEKFCADVEHELMSDLSSRVENL